MPADMSERVQNLLGRATEECLAKKLIILLGYDKNFGLCIGFRIEYAARIQGMRIK